MALIKCPEYNGQVSELAEACPHCGAPMAFALRRRLNNTRTIQTIVAWLVIGLVFYLVFGDVFK